MENNIFEQEMRVPVSKTTVVRIDNSPCYKSFYQLLKPAIMMIEDMETLDETYAVSNKLNGERALMTVIDCEMELDFGYKKEVKPVFSENDFVLDVEVVNGKIYCLDVLWVNKQSVIHLDLRGRIKSLHVDTAARHKIELQYYALFGSAEATEMIQNSEEGVIIQSSLSPYIKQYTRMYKVKREETIDLKVEGQLLIVEEPVRQVIAEVTEKLNNSSIVEYNYQKQVVVKERSDKMSPNSSQIVARAVSPLRVSVDEIYEYSKLERIKSHRELKNVTAFEKKGAILLSQMNRKSDYDPYDVWKLDKDSDFGKKTVEDPPVEEQIDKSKETKTLLK